LDNRKDIDRSQLSHLIAIQDKTKGLNEFEVQYGFKTDKTDKDCSVAKLGYGRIYGPVGSAEYLDNTYRHNLYADTEHDIDIKNCHPTLLIQLAKRYNVNLVRLTEYVKNREEYLQLAREYYKEVEGKELTRSDMKTMVIATLYGARGTVFDPIRKELDELTAILKEHHKTLYTTVSAMKERNKNGAFLAYVAQTEERFCLDAMDSYLYKEGRSVDSLAYDGLMVRKTDANEIFPIELLKGAEAFVKEKTQYEIELEIKPMERSINPLEVMTKQEKEENAYEMMKVEFELKHFYFEKTNTVVRENDDGRLQHFELKHAKVAFNGWIIGKDKKDKNILFFDKWIEDPRRKIIRELVFKMREDCKEDEYTLFRGFHYERITELPNEDESHEYINMFEDLVMANCGDNKEVADHVMKGFAHMIQHPFIKQGIITIFATPEEGTGKDTLMIIIKKVIGPCHTAHYTSTEQYWDKHDTKQEGMIFCYLEEACAQMNKERQGQLKARITSETLTCNPKQVKAYDVPNISNQYMTTNEVEPIKFSSNDRRGNLITPCARLKNQDWNKVYEIIARPAFVKAIGLYLERINIKGWNPRAYPETSVKATMKMLAKTVEEQYLEQWSSEGEWKLSKDIYNQYTQYCQEMGLPHAMNVISFSKKIIHYKDKLYQTRKGSKNKIYYASLDVNTELPDDEN
jgi:hypothetical protein